MIKIYHVSDLHFTAGATIATVPASEDLQARRLLEYIHARHFSRFPIIAPDVAGRGHGASDMRANRARNTFRKPSDTKRLAVAFA